MKIWITFEIEDNDLENINAHLKAIRKITDSIIALGYPYQIKTTSLPLRRDRDISKDFQRASEIRENK